MTLRFALTLAVACWGATASLAADPNGIEVRAAEPLVLGETFTLHSKALDEVRRINVYRPAVPPEVALPVLYMPDGGVHEDFVHLAGLVQISSLNGTMRPMLLVGIENTERRRDLTGPTAVDADREIAPRVGGSAAFRSFLESELLPTIEQRYATTGETAIIGESLAGLFVLETFVARPGLFDTSIAVDPSLWWNDKALLGQLPEMLKNHVDLEASLFLTSAGTGEMASDAARFAAILTLQAPAGLEWRYDPMPEETHGSIYHPAALRALRSMLGPEPVAEEPAP